MPSFAHLSSTHNVLYDNDIESSSLELNNGPLNNIVAVERCLFQHNTIHLPPDIVFQVHLASVLQRHQGNDLNMFQEITSWVSKHAVHHDVKFSTMHMLTWEQLVKKLTDIYKLHFLHPTLHHVQLSDGTKATVPIYDVKALLISFINDPRRMKTENFAPNYKIFSGKPMAPDIDP